MSQVYSLEPPTNGKVVLRTTMGDLDIELWPKEAPQAVRNFVQLCLEGYYDGTIFHRVLKDFMIQGGDPTGTGEGGESIYGRPFKDEFHSRLKFNHRGLIACANQNASNTNGAQFFITLDRADHMDRKSTIFGKITGDTLYNLMRFNELETDESDRPVDPPVLQRADVLLNPFDDLKPRVNRDSKEAAAAAEKARQEQERKNARKGAKNFKLISFGDEAEEEEAAEMVAAKDLKIKSAHDALEDEKLSKQAAVEVDLEKVREAMRAAKASAAAATEDGTNGAGPSEDWASKMRDKVASRKKGAPSGAFHTDEKKLHSVPKKHLNAEGDLRAFGDESEEEEEGEEPPAGGSRKRARLEGTGPGTKTTAAFVAPSRQIEEQDRNLLTDWERRRQEFKARKRLTGNREKDTMSKLSAFMQKIKKTGPDGREIADAGGKGSSKAIPAELPAQAPTVAAGDNAAAPQKDRKEENLEDQEEGYAGKVDVGIDHRAYMPAAWRLDTYLGGDGGNDGNGDGEEFIDDSLEALRGHKLQFHESKEKDSNARRDNIDDYVVLDPLLEAGKAKFNRQNNRKKKRETEWAGRARN